MMRRRLTLPIQALRVARVESFVSDVRGDAYESHSIKKAARQQHCDVDLQQGDLSYFGLAGGLPWT